MYIKKVKYIENGYFEVLYGRPSMPTINVIQDIDAMKMQVPTDDCLKDIILFLRKIKLEKIANENFDEIIYRNQIVVKKEDKTQTTDITQSLNRI